MKNAHQRQLITLGVLCACILGIQVFLAFPLLHTVANQANQLAQDRLKEAVAEDQQHSALVTKSEFTQIQATIVQLNTFFVDQNSVLDFISALENTAQQAGVQQTIQDLKPPAAVKESPIQFSVGGSYENLQRYLALLEHVPYYVNIMHATLQKSEATPGSNSTLNLSIDATIYWL